MEKSICRDRCARLSLVSTDNLEETIPFRKLRRAYLQRPTTGDYYKSTKKRSLRATEGGVAIPRCYATSCDLGLVTDNASGLISMKESKTALLANGYIKR